MNSMISLKTSFKALFLFFFSILSKADFYVNSRKNLYGRDKKKKKLDKCLNH